VTSYEFHEIPLGCPLILPLLFDLQLLEIRARAERGQVRIPLERWSVWCKYSMARSAYCAFSPVRSAGESLVSFSTAADDRLNAQATLYKLVASNLSWRAMALASSVACTCSPRTASMLAREIRASKSSLWALR
jgi:hypothetical protein